MTTLDAQQIAKVAMNAGATGDALITAVAIALAESGGQVGIVSPRNADGTYDRGLWQINDVHTQYDRSRLVTDPDYNAHAAADISGNWTNFAPWSTWWADPVKRTGPGQGAFKSHLGDATSGAAAAGGTNATAGHLGVSGGPLDLGGIATAAAPVLGLPGAIGDIISATGTGWVKDLAGALLPVFLTLVFTVAAFALIGMGLGRLTGRNPVDVFNKIAGTGQTASNVAALAAI